MRLSTMRVAYYGFRMRLSEGWTAFMFEPGPRGEEEYRDSLGIPRSTWYKAVRIGQSLHQLTLPELERIPVGNAEILLAVNSAILHDHNWVFEARTLSPKNLAQLVTERNKAAGDTREPLTSMVFRVPFLARQAIDKMLDAFMHRHELSSKSQALEMMVADRHDQTSLVASCFQAKQLMSAAVEKLRRRRDYRETEEMAWIITAAEVLDEAYEKALQATREKSSHN